jgi:hypothetical protein
MDMMQETLSKNVGKGRPRPSPDPAEIRRVLDVLFESGDVVEIRAFRKDRRCTISGYYNDFDKLVNDAEKINRLAGGVYVTLNRINPDLLARRTNRYEEYVSITTSDDQVALRRWFPIDFDPVRPAGISASDQEHDTSIEKASRVRTYLVKERRPDRRRYRQLQRRADLEVVRHSDQERGPHGNSAASTGKVAARS